MVLVSTTRCWKSEGQNNESSLLICSCMYVRYLSSLSCYTSTVTWVCYPLRTVRPQANVGAWRAIRLVYRVAPDSIYQSLRTSINLVIVSSYKMARSVNSRKREISVLARLACWLSVHRPFSERSISKSLFAGPVHL